MLNSSFGYIRKSNTWTPQVEVSGPNQGSVIPEHFVADPYLPVLATDEYHPNGGVVIPAGRFCGVGSRSAVYSSGFQQNLVASSRPTLTLANGRDTKPVGMATSNIFKQASEYMHDGYIPTVRKGFLAEVPYVVSVNGAHGEIKAGDRVGGYFGSSASTSVINSMHIGKPVKWVPKTLYSVTAAASATQNLTAAVYPGIQPEVVMTLNASGAAVTGLTSTFAYASGVWTVTLSGTSAATVTTVVYSMGQTEEQIAGTVTSVRNLVNVKAEDSLYQYVEDGPWYDIPPVQQRREVTAVALSTPTDPSTGENPTAVVAGRRYRVANYPMSIHHPVAIYVQGTVIDDNGNSTSYSSSNWYQLPSNMLNTSKGYFLGKYHSVNWHTGIIEISANITITAIRVTYSYLTDPREGAVLWGAGLQNLTDGGNLTPGAQVSSTTVVPANPRGVPAHLNATDVVGALRVFVH